MKKIIIIGAGISGLSLAYFLRKKNYDITVIDKANRVGGWIRTFQDDEVLFEQGPRGFRPQGKGKITLQVAQELGLPLIDAHKDASYRYIAHHEQMKRVSLWHLVQYGGIGAALTESLQKKCFLSDESIASFFQRRLSKKYVDNLIYPLCQGIFAQDPAELSMKACFPSLWAAEQQFGSLTYALWKNKKEKKRAALCSFADGMESLPQTMATYLLPSLLLEKEVLDVVPMAQGVKVILKEFTLDADLVILAANHLFSLVPHFPQKNINLTVVNLAFAKKIPLKKGFGFLCKEHQKLLGITFDSMIFPFHNRTMQTRLCAMLRGNVSQEEAKTIVQNALSHYLNISEIPEKWLITQVNQAIYQYPVGHIENLKTLESSLPKSIKLTGARFYGVSVNDCLHHSYELAKIL